MSTADIARRVQGYQAPTSRPSCRDCKHSQTQYVDRSPPYDRSWLKCMRGGFSVAAGGVCAKHEPSKPSKPSEPAGAAQ